MSEPPFAAEPVVKLAGIGKQFESVTESPRSVLEFITSRFSITNRRYVKNRPIKRDKQPLWVVRDVNLEVMPGECLGILGRNGSGKSTLLKLITRIIKPTTGYIMVRGRVSALLELGAGFHPDLTGRENIYLNASIMGLDKHNIEDHFDSVVAFSGLEPFIDAPVKFYSSGMYMRLGFSVAVHVNPQILIVDEILAVGDQAFQEKCINHIYEMKSKGTTIVLVSHNMDLMRELCTSAIWMENGEAQAQGSPEALIQKYLGFLHERGYQQRAHGADAGIERSGSGEIQITGLRVFGNREEPQEGFLTGQPLTIEISYKAHRPVENPEFGLAIYRQDGVQVNGPNSTAGGLHLGRVEGTGVVSYHIPSLPLLPAQYVITAAIHDPRYGLTFDHHDKAYPFQVRGGGTRELYGLVEIPASWSCSTS